MSQAEMIIKAEELLERLQKAMDDAWNLIEELHEED